MRLKNFIQFFFVTVFFLLIFVPSVHSLDVDFFVSPSHSDYGAPIPLYGKTFANNIFFFDHPCAAGSTSNFKDCPSLLHLQDGDVNVDDLLGAPGLPFSRVASGTEVADMLADPVGLCYENFLLNSVCSRDALSNPQLNSPSWSQLVADLRNINAGEPNVVGTTFPDVILDGDVAAPPYDKSMLGSVVANLTDFRRESPPAVCYDITMADDFIACPVYGRIMVRRNRNPLIPIDATEFVELQSPILLYRKMQGGIFKMAGYLSNPSLSLQLATGSGAEQIRMLTQQLPLAIASGKFSNRQGGLNLADIAVLGSSTAPHGLCKWARQTFQAAGRGQLPHGLDCTYGYTWVRKQAAFTTPHETFDAEDLLFGPPKVFDLAVGNDHGKAVLFAPSNAPVANHCFVYKYYEEGMNPVGHPLMPMLGQLIPPRAVEVLPPQAGFCPFKIAVSDINGDGDSDFAITWKNVEDQRIDSEHKFWSSNYAPFFSVYVSSRDAEGKLQYNLLKDFNVPKVASPEADDQAQLAAIAFGTKKNQNFLVVGNQKRILSGDLQRAYDYVFPVSGGIVDDLNVRLVPVDFHPQTDANLPGVADLSVDSSGNIASLIKAPFIPASEGCDISNGQVYGVLWSGDGTPNRCSCRVEGRIVLPDENNDADGDEIAGSCDTCEGKANIGDEDRDAIDGACDNCPSFANPGQEDVDEDVVGDVCDMCPRKFNPDQIDLYFGYWSYNSDKLNLCEPNCIFGFRDASGVNHPVLDINDRLLGNDLIKACETRGAHNVPDTDHDSIPDPWDDCVYVINPDQTDTDRDGSGDACDCDNDNGVRDDCDNDDVPNRFDRSPLDPAVSLLQPMRQLPDMVYDPMPRTIAVRSDLRTAQSDVPASNVGEFFYSGPNTWLPAGSELIIRDQPIGSGVERNRCGMPPNTFPGPNPCDYMGRDENGSELTVVVPKVVVVNPGPEDTPSKPSPAENLQQFCISKVGREDPRTAALFEGERKMIIAANDRAASITGIKDYDLFVGGEGGLKHFECAFTGGALANVAKATGVQATTSSETTAPFGVWQLSGLPPMKYERRPTVAAVVPGSPLRLAPLDAPSVLSASISLAPNVSAFLPGVNQEVVLPSEGVQVGVRRYNLNGNMVIKALNESDDFTAEGTYFSVSDPQTLIVMDFKAYPAPASRKPVEHRQYNLETVFQELTKRVADLTAQGKPVTLDIYRNLPWESPMQPEFLVAQESLPGSADVSRAMGVGANTDEIGSIGSGSNQAIVPSYIIPPGFGMAGGGCGCRLNAPVSPLMAILTWLMLLAPLPILGYCRRKRNR